VKKTTIFNSSVMIFTRLGPDTQCGDYNKSTESNARCLSEMFRMQERQTFKSCHLKK